jgi:hypothetical protein
MTLMLASVIRFSPRSIVYWGAIKRDVTYPELLLHLYTLGQSLDHLLVEVIQSEIDALELVKVLEGEEHLAHSIYILDLVVLEGQLGQLGALLQVL